MASCLRGHESAEVEVCGGTREIRKQSGKKVRLKSL